MSDKMPWWTGCALLIVTGIFLCGGIWLIGLGILSLQIIGGILVFCGVIGAILCWIGGGASDDNNYNY